MKSALVALLASASLTGCFNLPKSLGEKSSGYAYVPLDPLAVETVPGANCAKVADEKGRRMEVGKGFIYLDTLLALPDNAVRIAIREIDAKSNLSFGASSVGLAGSRYQVVLDYINVDTSNIPFYLDVDVIEETIRAETIIPLPSTINKRVVVNSVKRLNQFELEGRLSAPERLVSSGDPRGGQFEIGPGRRGRILAKLDGVYNIPVYVGVGLRLTADIQVLTGTVNLSSLTSIAASVEAKSATGSLVVQTLGITGSQVSTSLPLPSEINQTTVQNAILALGGIKAVVATAEKGITVTPRVTGIYLPVDNGTQELVNRLVSELARSPIPWERACIPRPAQVSSPRESHPQALPEPDVNLSIHPAPIVQSS